MKSTTILFFLLGMLMLPVFNFPKGETQTSGIPDAVIQNVIAQLKEKCVKENCARTDSERAVRQTASLWRPADGSAEEFSAFCLQHFITSAAERDLVFNKLSRSCEILWGHYNKISLQLKEPVQLDSGDFHPVDEVLSGYEPSAHFSADWYDSKIAFITMLNFPFYSLEEKKALGAQWSRKEWAYARLGNVFVSRVPAELNQVYGRVQAASDLYISQYNIYMGQVLDKNGKTLFPENLKLLSHWNLRDELKANYGSANGLEKQQLIFDVMNRIISQDIPADVVDHVNYRWDPYHNKVYRDGQEVEYHPEPNTRYQHIIDTFHAQKQVDPFYPAGLEDFVKRSFSGSMEIMQPEVEELFSQLLSSPQVKKVAQLVKKRLKRKLQPWDIWYSGFMARGGIAEEKLDAIVREKYPDAAALEKDLVNILLKLSFSQEKAEFLAARITVDDARGSGHAWGPQMRSEKAHLRTRIPDDGMNYKGYNIAIHEFGHNVEQIISLNDVDYYLMQGVPNNAFTEALAFVFQSRDLEILGMQEPNPLNKHFNTLETFWSMYESMGVSLVDMRVWKWLYQNPDADAAQLKTAVIQIAKDTWNEFYAPVFGIKDQPILAIYSHIVSYPLYLSYYSYGQIIYFQVEQYIKDKNFGAEVSRMFALGQLHPQLWMKNAVGSEISIQPILAATDEALKFVK